MSRLPLVLALSLALAPALAGCMSQGDAPEGEAPAVKASAEDAGALDGPAPAAAKEAYEAQSEAGAVTVHPLSIQTTPAKAPYTQEFSGEFQPYQCMPTGGGLPLGGLGLAQGGQWFDVAEAFSANDVFSYEVTLTFTNTEQSWGELHLWHQFDQVGNYWTEPTSEGRGEIVLNFTGQGFILNAEPFALVGVDCWYGQVTSPLPYTISVSISFAEGAVPAQTPVLVTVPEGATRLFTSGLALDGAAPVESHYRVFAPDDSVLCECGLASDETLDVLELPAPGDYVILVDHTSNGFVAFGLDAPSPAPLQPLGTTFVEFVLASSDGGPVDETVSIDLPSTPLNMGTWVFAPGAFDGPPSVGAGHNVRVEVSNSRGVVLRNAMVGYLTYHAAAPGFFMTNDWFAIPLDGEWEFFTDHHAFNVGQHTVTVQADQLRGEARMIAMLYDRASAAPS